MKRKILFINGHLNTGGVEKSLLDVLLHLDYSKYDVDLLLLEQLGDYLPLLPPQVRVIYRSVERTYGSVIKVLFQSLCDRDWFTFRMRLIFLAVKFFGQKRISLAEKLLTEGKRYDAVIAFRPGLSTQLAAFAVKADKRVTWWHHGEIFGDREGYLEATALCDTVVAVSESCREMLNKEFPVLTDKLVVIPNMLDSNEVKKRAGENDPYADDELIHIVSVGRLAPEKHFENVIYAAHVLKKNGVDFRWHHVGDGALKAELKAKAEEMNVTDRFVFEGNQVNPYPYIKNADLFVHPSYIESFGIVVAEALALGVPCVVTKSSGVLDFLQEGVNAVLTEQSPSDLAEKVFNVLNDEQLLARLRENSHCPEHFSPNEVMKKIDLLMEKNV